MSTTCVAGQSHNPRTVWRRRAAAAISLVIPLALAASAEAIVVSLQQVNSSGNPISSVTATGTTQTIVFANLVVTGSGPPLPVTNLFSFSTVLSWATSSPGVSASDLFTVNSSGSASNLAMNVTGTSMLFYNEDTAAQYEMNTNSIDSSYQRYLSVFTDAIPGPTLADPAGGIVIGRIRFAVTSGITNATFSLSLDGSGGGYEFLDGTNVPYTFSSGGGSLVVIPEPSTASACLAGFCVICGWTAWRSRRRRSPTSAASTRC